MSSSPARHKWTCSSPLTEELKTVNELPLSHVGSFCSPLPHIPVPSQASSSHACINFLSIAPPPDPLPKALAKCFKFLYLVVEPSVIEGLLNLASYYPAAWFSHHPPRSQISVSHIWVLRIWNQQIPNMGEKFKDQKNVPRYFCDVAYEKCNLKQWLYP